MPSSIDELERTLGTWRQYKTQAETADGGTAAAVPLDHVGHKGRPCALAGQPVSRNTKWWVGAGRVWNGACCNRRGSALVHVRGVGSCKLHRWAFTSHAALPPAPPCAPLQPCHQEGLQGLLRQDPEAGITPRFTESNSGLLLCCTLQQPIPPPRAAIAVNSCPFSSSGGGASNQKETQKISISLTIGKGQGGGLHSRNRVTRAERVARLKDWVRGHGRCAQLFLQHKRPSSGQIFNGRQGAQHVATWAGPSLAQCCGAAAW